MKLLKLGLLIAAWLVLLLATSAQSQFVKALGGSESDWAEAIIQASDGGFVLAGQTKTFGAGAEDILIAKLDVLGNPLWARTLGGSSDDKALSVIEASDGGFVVAGKTYSFGARGEDLIIAKFDVSGNHLWTKTLGGSGQDYGWSVVGASDGGFVVAGETNSFGAGSQDLFLSKFDGSGNHLWTKVLGGANGDLGTSVIEASDGGFVIGGVTVSFGAGNPDFLLAKFDASGDHLWTRTLGGSNFDEAISVIEASDGALVGTGYTSSFGAGNADLLFAKFDSVGTFLWARTLGGIGYDQGEYLIQASDGGFVATGITGSFGVPGYDLILAKLDASGNHLWTRILSEAEEDRGYCVIQTSFGGIVAVGATYSFGAGSADILLTSFYTDGKTCIGEFVSPEFDSISPDTSSPDPTVTPWSPTVTSRDPTVTSPPPTLTVVCDETPPSIISVTDVGNDQGRQVRVKWDRCYYDEVGSPVTITEYSLWRRIDEDKTHNQSKEVLQSNFGILNGGRLYPPGDWDFIKTVPARGESTYSTVCPTLGDSSRAEGMYWSVFFVSAMTLDPLLYFDSDPDSGYSLDNIPPRPIRDLNIDSSSWFTLKWTVPGEYVGEQSISNYDIRYNTIPVGPDTQDWWDDAVPCTGVEFYNLMVGEADSLQLATESWCHPEVYFAIKGLDSRPNASEISNIVHFKCGDAKTDGVVDLGDVLHVISYLYKNGPAPEPNTAGDPSCDMIIDLGDLLYLISYLYKGGPAPCSP